jgi:tripartite-type tricarboxylate transporter receptor subunit TctC
LPPIADVVPGYEVLGWNGILAPAGTPRAIIGRLNAELVKVLRTPAVIALQRAGVEPKRVKFVAFKGTGTAVGRWVILVHEHHTG